MKKTPEFPTKSKFSLLSERHDMIEPGGTAVAIAHADDAPASGAIRGVALHDLKPNSCLYAVSEPEPRPHLFCGERRAAGRPWCDRHAAVCIELLKPMAEVT